MSALKKPFDDNAARQPRAQTWQNTDVARNFGQNLLQGLQKQFPDVADLTWLVRNGAALDARNNRGETPLHLALRNGFHDLVQEMIARGAPVNAANDAGNTPLIVAATGRPDTLQNMIDAGAELTRHNKGGNSALVCATAANKIDNVKILLAHGAPPEKAASDMAARLHRNDILRLLQEAQQAEHDALVRQATVADHPIVLMRPVRYRPPQSGN